MADAALGAFPVILSELDSEGNILSKKGYPHFSRWGGLQYEGIGVDAKWKPTGDVNQGAYLFHFRYENLLTGLVEVKSGTMVLLR